MARRGKNRRWTSWSERELPHYQNDCQCLMPLFVVACARLLQYEANFADPEVPTSDVWLAIAYGEPEGPGQRRSGSSRGKSARPRPALTARSTSRPSPRPTEARSSCPTTSSPPEGMYRERRP